MANSKRPSFFKRKFIVLPQLQWGMAKSISAFGTILIIEFSALYYFVLSKMTKDIKVDIIEQCQEYMYLTLEFSRSIYLLITIGFSLAAMITLLVWAILFSHKFAGPLYRIQKVLKDHLDGNPTHEIVIRKGDFTAELADIANEIIKKK